MKLKTMLGSFLLAMALAASPAMAVARHDSQEGQTLVPCDKGHLRGSDFFKDPIGVLEGRKQEIQKLLKDHKISSDRAREWTEKIDGMIADLKAFDKLSLEGKKEKLLADCQSKLDRLAAGGRITKEQADSLFKAYSDKISRWDGTGYPFFAGLRHKHHRNNE